MGQANPNTQVYARDQIVSVCGTSGKADDLKKVLTSNQTVDLALRRRNFFFVSFVKSGALGVEFVSAARLVVRIVKPGPIQLHNESCKPWQEVLPGDECIGVGDKMVEHDNLVLALGALKDGDAVELKFK